MKVQNTHINVFNVFWGLLLALSLSSCAVNSNDTIAMSESVSAAEKGIKRLLGDEQKKRAAIDEFPKVFAILPLQNTTEEPIGPGVLRIALQGHLSTMNYQFVHWQKVEQLVESYAIDQTQIRENPTQVMTQLGVDGAIRGRVTDFERLFVGVYSQIKLGVYLEMLDIQGNVIWSDEFDVTSRAGGVSTTPWGILLNVALATMNLDDESLFAAADELGREVLKVVPNPPGFNNVNGPVIISVIHDGSRKVLRYGDTIKVGMRGEAGLQAATIIEGMDIVDMKEQEPGVYFAEIPVAKSWESRDISVYARLTSNAGIVSKRLSEIGLLDFDNTAPALPAAAVRMTAGIITVEPVLSQLTEKGIRFKVYDSNGLLLKETPSLPVALETKNVDFAHVDIQLSAVDDAGNESDKTRFSLISYPFAGMHEYKKLTTLPAVIDAPVLLISDSPVSVQQEVNIAPGGELHISPGTILNFSREGTILTQGQLFIYGSQRKVVFRAENTQQPPQKFLTVDTSGGVSISGGEFTGADVSLTSKKGNVSIVDTTFTDNTFSAIVLEGTGSATLNSVTVRNTNTAGVVLSEMSKLKVSNSLFENNEPFHIQNSSIYPVTIADSTLIPEASAATILGEVDIQ